MFVNLCLSHTLQTDKCVTLDNYVFFLCLFTIFSVYELESKLIP